MTPYEEYEFKSNNEFRKFKKEQSDFRKEEKRKSKERIRKMKARIKGSEDPIKPLEVKEKIIIDQEFKDIKGSIPVKKVENINLEGKSIFEYLHIPK